MIIHIHKDRLISDIQQEFNTAYPYLKIELFVARPATRQSVPGKSKLSPQLALKDVVPTWVVEEEDVELTDSMSVHRLESIFTERFGLDLQVFRRSGNLWIETTITDNWSLKQQNDHGKEITMSLSGGPLFPRKAADNP